MRDSLESRFRLLRTRQSMRHVLEKSASGSRGASDSALHGRLPRRQAAELMELRRHVGPDRSSASGAASPTTWLLENDATRQACTMRA